MTMLSRSGQTDPGGKMTNRLDIPMSDDLHDLIVVKSSEASRPKSEYARDLIVQALSAPMLIGLPDETRGQLASLAQMAGVSPNDLADVLGVDDSKWEITIRRGEPPGGFVRVQITSEIACES